MCVFGLRGLFEHGVVPEPRDALERLVSDGVRPILAVAGNSAKNLILRRMFGETALQLLRESPLPLYLAQ
jgi:hypothetical protein